MEAYENLQDTLINNIQNVILDKGLFLPLIMVGVVEELKEYPKKRNPFMSIVKSLKMRELQ